MKKLCIHTGCDINNVEEVIIASKIFMKTHSICHICDKKEVYNYLKSENFEAYRLYNEDDIDFNEKKQYVYNELDRHSINYRAIWFSQKIFTGEVDDGLEKQVINGLYNVISLSKTNFNADYFFDFAGDEIGHNIFKIFAKLVNAHLITYRESLYPDRMGFTTDALGVWRVPKYNKINPSDTELEYVNKFIRQYFEKETVFWGTPQSRDFKISYKMKNLTAIFSKAKRRRALNSVKRVYNKKRLNGIYDNENILSNLRYHYLPLHYPLDSQLTYRARPFVDQIGFAINIANFIPHNQFLVVKEHPHARGAITYKEIIKLKKIENIIILHPWVNSHKILKKAKSVIIINSTVGLEALYHKIPVILFGRNYLMGHNLVNEVKDLYELYNLFTRRLHRPSKEEFVNFLVAAYRNSYPVSYKNDSTKTIMRPGTREQCDALIHYIETYVEKNK